jgi:hypothetical protein
MRALTRHWEAVLGLRLRLQDDAHNGDDQSEDRSDVSRTSQPTSGSGSLMPVVVDMKVEHKPKRVRTSCKRVTPSAWFSSQAKRWWQSSRPAVKGASAKNLVLLPFPWLRERLIRPEAPASGR